MLNSMRPVKIICTAVCIKLRIKKFTIIPKINNNYYVRIG